MTNLSNSQNEQTSVQSLAGEHFRQLLAQRDRNKPEAVKRESAPLPTTGGVMTLRQRRMLASKPKMTSESEEISPIGLEAAPKHESFGQDRQPGLLGGPDIESVHADAEKGLERAMPRIEPAEGYGKVRGGIAAIGPDGEIEEDSELVDAADLGEIELAPGPGDVAQILADKEPARANAKIAKEAFTSIKPESPVAGNQSVEDPTPQQGEASDVAPQEGEENQEIKTATGVETAKPSGIVFEGNADNSAIQREVSEHEADGTVEKDKPDILAPIITDGIAERTNPVVDGKEVKNIANDTVVSNQAALLNGEQLGQAQEAVIGKPVREPHPFAPASADEPAEKTGDDLTALNDLLAHPEKPLVGQEPKSVVPIQESSTSVGTERQVQETAVPLTDQVSEPVLEKASDMPTSSIEVKNFATPEIPPVIEAEQATENASAVPLERQGLSEQDTTRPEFWAENGPKAAQAVQAEQPALAQPAQAEPLKPATGLLARLFGRHKEKHAAEKMAYVKNPHVTAADVLKYKGGDSEEPVIAKVA